MRSLALALAGAVNLAFVISVRSVGEEQKQSSQVQIENMQNGTLALRKDSTVSVSFPTAMVPSSQIDVIAASSPVSFKPALEGKFMWKSQTDGEFSPEAVPPGTRFEIRLAENLRDLNGNPLEGPPALGVAVSPEFTISSSFDAGDLPRRPSVPVHISHPVAPAELATTTASDAESRSLGTGCRSQPGRSPTPLPRDIV